MSGTGQSELQKSLYQKLSGDAALMAQVTGIYDYVPANATYPYITLGEAAVRDWSTTTTTGAAYLVTCRVFSREGGRKQAIGALERLHALLHRASLTVTGYTSVLSRYESSEIRLEDDGATYQGMLRLRVLLQAA